MLIKKIAKILTLTLALQRVSCAYYIEKNSNSDKSKSIIHITLSNNAFTYDHEDGLIVDIQSKNKVKMCDQVNKYPELKCLIENNNLIISSGNGFEIIKYETQINHKSIKILIKNTASYEQNYIEKVSKKMQDSNTVNIIYISPTLTIKSYNDRNYDKLKIKEFKEANSAKSYIEKIKSGLVIIIDIGAHDNEMELISNKQKSITEAFNLQKTKSEILFKYIFNSVSENNISIKASKNKDNNNMDHFYQHNKLSLVYLKINDDMQNISSFKNITYKSLTNNKSINSFNAIKQTLTKTVNNYSDKG